MPQTLEMPEAAPMTRDRARLDLVLGQLDALPTLSPVATRLLSLGSDDDVDLDAIVRLIEADPALTGKILGLCRRAGFAVSEQITTVKHAAVMLGLETVRSAVLSVAVYEALESLGEEADGRAIEAAARLGSESLARAEFDRGGFWRYSIGVATAAELIAAERRTPGLRPQEAFVAGLLAEIGKLMLDFAVPKGYARVLGYAGQRNVSASSAAQELLGLDHHEAGAHVAGRWGLPDPLLDVIRGSEGDAVLTGVVRAAISAARGMHIGFSGEPASTADARSIATVAGVSQEAMGSIMDRLHGSVSERCSVLGLDEVSTHDMLLHSIAGANRQLDSLNQSLAARAQASDAAERTLRTLEWFGRAVSQHTSQRLAGAIAVSASRVIGGERWALVRAEGLNWVWSEHDGQGHRVRREESPAPRDLDEAINAMGGAGLHRVNLSERAAVLGRGVRTRRASPAVAALTAQWAMAIRLAEQAPPAAEGTSAEESKAIEPLEAPREASAGITDTELLDGVLGAVHGVAERLRQQGPSLKALAGDSKNVALVSAVVASASTLGGVSRGVTALRRTPRPQPGMHSLGDIAASAVATATRASGFGGRVNTDGVEPSYYVCADRGMVESSLTELLLNAMAASGTGDILIAAQRAGSKRRWEIRVTDRGIGFTPGDESRLFEPFVTGNRDGRHAGLGLTRVRTWMRSHGGDATLTRTEDGRTRATLIFTELGSPAEERSTAA